MLLSVCESNDSKNSLYFYPMMFTAPCYRWILIFSLSSFSFYSQKNAYTHADSLKGTYGATRSWWDVLHYRLNVAFQPLDSSISGSNTIHYKVLKEASLLQLDLMQPMLIDSIFQNGKACSFKRDGNAFMVLTNGKQVLHSIQTMQVFFHGKPVVAKLPPWDGGLIWTKDRKGDPWISIACQGMAAGVWFPNKDHMADEPDSASMFYTVPKELMAVSNGLLRGIQVQADGRYTYHWAVVNPINNYNIIPYIGKYTNLKDTFLGKKGLLSLNYWVLQDNYEKAGAHFAQVKEMLRCFEDWFGPYPFYSDGYKLVEAPFLGMEHQSAIAYGNNFKQGYMGRDLSGTGWGLKWDFIIVHESGHEWFGNNISAKDVADNWIHESFTAYSENLFVESRYGKEAGADYVIGTRKAILNDKPIIADYGVNRGGSNDLYYKGANMLHTIRQLVNRDSLWKETLRGLNKTFWHQTVTTAQIESYLSRVLAMQLQPVFDQYLRTVQIPVLEYKQNGNKIKFRWTNCVKGFQMPVDIYQGGVKSRIQPTTKWQSMPWDTSDLQIDRNYYCTLRRVDK